MRKFWLFPVVVFVLSISVVAQTAMTCSAEIERVIATVDDVCADTARNQACYGNVSLSVIPRGTATDFTFQQVGDVMDVAQIQTLRTLPLNEETGQWGVAMLRLQANLPATIPGQNVTFLVFGDTQLTSAVSESNATARPMQAFYLQSGLGQPACNEVPESGLLVQTPDGAGQVTFSMNGMNVNLGSTAYFSVNGDSGSRNLRISPIEGAAGVRYHGQSYPIVAGTRFSIDLDDRLLPIDGTEFIESYDLDFLDDLPLDLLEREIDIEEPFSDDELDDLFDRFDEGLPLCGEDPYPDCSHLSRFFGGDGCAFDDEGVCLEDDFEFLWGDDGIGDDDFEWLDYEDFDEFDEFDEDFEEDLEDIGDEFDDFDDFDEELDDTFDELDDTFDDVDDSLDDLGDFDDDEG